MQLFWDIFLLKNVNKLRYFNILFLSMLENILQSATFAFQVIPLT